MARQYIISQRPNPRWVSARWGRRARLWLVARPPLGPRAGPSPPWLVTTVCSSEAEGKLAAELSFLPLVLPCQPGLYEIFGVALAAQCFL